MKVNYLPKNRSKYSYFKRVLALVAIFIIGAVIIYFLNPAVISFVSPIWKIENIIISRNEAQPIFGEQTQENRLLELVGRKQNSKTVVVAVLTHPPQTPYDVIIIDAGSNESITIGAVVSMPEGSILGLVSDVFPKNAKVKLYSANGEETNAVLERNDVSVILVGQGGGNFRISLPRDVSVEKGDRILSTDITARFMAVVEDISVEPTDAFQTVLANGPTNIFNLRYVFVAP